MNTSWMRSMKERELPGRLWTLNKTCKVYWIPVFSDLSYWNTLFFDKYKNDPIPSDVQDGGGGGGLSFLLGDKNVTFSVAVRLSLGRNLRQVWWWRVTVAASFDVISSRWSRSKVKLVDKMMRSTYLWVILNVKNKKSTNSRGFYLISNSW